MNQSNQSIHRSIDQTLHAPEPSDRLLIGVLRVLRTLIKRKVLHTESDVMALTRLVYTRCLFAIPSESSAGSICKSHASRTAAYALLMEMAQGIPVPTAQHSHNTHCIALSYVFPIRFAHLSCVCTFRPVSMSC